MNIFPGKHGNIIQCHTTLDICLLVYSCRTAGMFRLDLSFTFRMSVSHRNYLKESEELGSPMAVCLAQTNTQRCEKVLDAMAQAGEIVEICRRAVSCLKLGTGTLVH